MKLYRISNWQKNFENNRTKTVGELSWVRVPNRHDGENYTALMAHQNGAKVFSAFILMVEVASKCDPRGVLVRGNGRPHTAASLHLVTRAPAEWFESAISYLEQHTDWLESKEVNEDWQLLVSGLPPDWQSACSREEKDKEKEEEQEIVLSFPLKFGALFQSKWGEWTKYRQKYGKPKAGFQNMFQQQLNWLDRYDEDVAVGILEKSMMNGWQGLFQPSARDQIQGKQKAKTCL